MTVLTVKRGGKDGAYYEGDTIELSPGRYEEVIR